MQPENHLNKSMTVCSRYRTMPSAIRKYFPSFSNFATFEIIAKYEKRGKYLPLLYTFHFDV